MKEEYNSIVSGEPIRSYMNCCHSYTAAILKVHMDDIKDSDRLVFLGSPKDVVHSILVSEKGEILADSEFSQEGIKVELDMDAGLYRVETQENSGVFIHMNVVHDEPIGAFKERFLNPIRDSMYTNPKPDVETDLSAFF